MAERIRYIVSGQVQGVGFRPAIYRFANTLKLTGFVQNSTSGVIIEIQGSTKVLIQFDQQLSNHYPPMAQVHGLVKETIATQPSHEFKIAQSIRSGELLTGMPPDSAVCRDCVNELFDPHDRRYAYPFINCTNCGPRFSIIKTLPYDRPHTTMIEFKQCDSCQQEYDDPHNRRFDAQPNACSDCGPTMRLLNHDHQPVASPAPLDDAVKTLSAGLIVAIKGLGGYHLSCDAQNNQAIDLLRSRKKRPHKAFAIMFQSIDQIKEYCHVSAQEAQWLSSPSAPIVVLNRKDQCPLSKSISPDTNTIGAFLPYTPLHHLLLSKISPLLMTSANKSDEPIVIDESHLDHLLGSIADLALIHNRPILRRVDDSVMALVNEQPLFYRRSRGLVPNPIHLPFSGPNVLACGSDLKNTFALTKQQQLYLSQHIGDLKDYHAKLFYHEQLADLKQLLKVSPELIVHDLHPNYVSTQFAQSINQVDKLGVQHHHAHIASCMIEHQLQEPVIGVALDGTGYGDDGHLWGGEFFINDLKTYTRYFHFDYSPLPGLEQAIYHPSRMAFAYLNVMFQHEHALELTNQWLPDLTHSDSQLLYQMIENKIQSPLTSSAGRLFDAVSALLGFRNKITYEGQAAIQLETLVDRTLTDHYDFETKQPTISFKPMFKQLIKDLENNCSPAIMATKFHHTIAAVLNSCCQQLRIETSINKIVLSGGVFQNKFLLATCINNLNKLGFNVYSHHIVPPNDGGLAVGQAAIGLATINRS